MANFFPSGTVKILTNAHAIRGRPTLKDVERFRHGSVRELKAKCQKKAKDTRKITRNTQRNDENTQTNSNETRTLALTSTLANSTKQVNTNSLVSRDFAESYSEELRHSENVPNNMDAILESFKTFDAFRESRSLGLISFTLRISFLCIILFSFTILVRFLTDYRSFK